MDPDPDPKHQGMDPGSGSWKIIRILTNTDPQHWLMFSTINTQCFLKSEHKQCVHLMLKSNGSNR